MWMLAAPSRRGGLGVLTAAQGGVQCHGTSFVAACALREWEACPSRGPGAAGRSPLASRECKPAWDESRRLAPGRTTTEATRPPTAAG